MSYNNKAQHIPLILATLNNNTRDGQLIVVSADHQTYAISKNFQTLQNALDDWDRALDILGAIFNDLRLKPGIPFSSETKFHCPLPRSYQWLDGSAYVNHVELVRKARGADMPESFWTDPLMYQGGSDAFTGPHDPISLENEAWGIDLEAEVAIITNDVPMGISSADASKHIQLLMLVNDVSLRNLIPGELSKGFGFMQSKPSTSFSPFAITPAVLKDAWKDAKVHLPLCVSVQRKDEKLEFFGKPNAGVDMTFSFADLIAHAAKTRHLSAGTIIGSGTVSNYDRSLGSCCLAEKRMLETLEHHKATTSFLNFGDRVVINMVDDKGQDLFGTIDQTVHQYIKGK